MKYRHHHYKCKQPKTLIQRTRETRGPRVQRMRQTAETSHRVRAQQATPATADSDEGEAMKTMQTRRSWLGNEEFSKDLAKDVAKLKKMDEGEPYCPGCFKHADSCQCLESFFCDDPRCFGNASEGTEE